MRMSGLILSLLACSGLMAQRFPVTGGLQVGLGIPVGGFADKRDPSGAYLGANEGGGVHFGGHLDFSFALHHQIRLVANVNGFASREQDLYGAGSYQGTRQNAFSVAQLGADYVCNLRSPSMGAYVLAGVSLNRVKAKADFSRYADTETTQSGRFGARIGGGYTFNQVFSLEGHLNRVSVDLGYDALTWVGVSAVFRFGL
ncbi:MAG TPA: hypothetical protein VF804_06120 [Holophagaceae bacterium]